MTYSLLSIFAKPVTEKTPLLIKFKKKRAALEVDAINVKALVGGLCGLESHFSKIWDMAAYKTDLDRAIAVLKNYSENYFLSYRHYRKEINDLIKDIRYLSRGTLSTTEGSLNNPEIRARIQDLYQKVEAEGEAAICLRYLLVHASGFYTAALRAEVIQKNAADELIEHTALRQAYAAEVYKARGSASH